MYYNTFCVITLIQEVFLYDETKERPGTVQENPPISDGFIPCCDNDSNVYCCVEKVL